MKARGFKRDLRRAMKAVRTEISGNAAHGTYGRGLSAEGYAGGYRDALSDVLAAMNGYPSSTSRFWPNPWPSQEQKP